ncbi:uncharacterized protein LOC143861405 [Tasmannia lanceolata]|uniref:uncharacterized protein LOC143861405 n=1 Tax=Tasmannia lanceolata TaxID=3420 RepID=UPI004063D8D0
MGFQTLCLFSSWMMVMPDVAFCFGLHMPSMGFMICGWVCLVRHDYGCIGYLPMQSTSDAENKRLSCPQSSSRQNVAGKGLIDSVFPALATVQSTSDAEITRLPCPPSNFPIQAENSKFEFESSRPKRLDAWSSLFQRKDIQSISNLKFFNKEEATEKSGFDFEDEELEENNRKWQNCLVGYLLGRRPYFVSLKEHLHNIWKMKGEFQMFNLHSGFFLFQFNNSEDCETIMEGGNYSFGGRPLVLRRWTPDLALEKLSLSTVPVWIRFPGLNLRFWSAHCLGKIGRKIGNPLYMDSQTTGSTRLSYARICVEVEAGMELPDQIEITTSLGTTYQKVEYEWRPPSCKECVTFNHSSSSCPKKVAVKPQKQEWRQVSKIITHAANSQVTSADPSPEVSPMNPNKDAGIPHEPEKKALVNVSNPYELLQDVDVESILESADPSSTAMHPSPSSLSYCIQDLNENWNVHTNYHHSARGRIWIIWDPLQLHVNILADSAQFVHVDVHNLQSQDHFLLTVVYARNKGHERHSLWEDLVELSQNIDTPWIVIGDFNTTRFTEERLGGAGPVHSDLNDFNQCIDECSLADLKSVGQLLSWHNNVQDSEIKWRRLDRALVNIEWLCEFPSSFADYKAPWLSDHSPIVVQLKPHTGEGKKSFKFINAWLDEPSLFEIVERAWSKKVHGNPMFILVQKLREAKFNIKEWNANVFGRIDIEAPILRQNLETTQIALATNPANTNLRMEANLAKLNYSAIAQKEEALYRQKSRIQWLNLGDSNTKFFHSALKSRRNQNSIQGLQDVDGEITTDQSKIFDILVEFFQSLLNSQTNSVTPNDQIPNPRYKLSSEESSHLSKPFSSEEIKAAVFSQNGNKAPGPDGFNGEFFKKIWYLIGKDTERAIQHFFKSGKLLPEVNTTFIALIPKSPDASSHEKFRPISLCNFLYKTITKLLANRLKPLMDRIISPTQSAFVKGRLIQDNILLSHDLCHNFHKKSNLKAMCVKMDLRKAFDSVRWDSLIEFMARIGFNDIWCRWGDPLSPLLFCFVMEMLSCIIFTEVAEGNLPTPFKKVDISITHLFFADDVMFFVEASAAAARGLLSCTKKFKSCSGLDVNLSKLECFFTGISDEQKREITRILNMEEGSLPIRYLGLPLVTSRLTSADCKPLTERVRKKINSWSNKFLSRAGRVELVNSVLNSFQLYWSSAFHIPAETLNYVEKILRDFIWSGCRLQRRYHPIAWRSLCLPKIEGGIGIRRLADVNRTFQMKHVWNLLQNRDTPWNHWFHGKYVRNRNFWLIKMPSRPSWAVRSVFKARESLKKSICYSIGDGAHVNFWHQPWLPSGIISSLSSLGTIINHIPNNATVMEVFQRGYWPDIQNEPHLKELKNIISTAILTPNSSDKLIWKETNDGTFTVKSAWNSLRPHLPKVDWFSSIWFQGSIPRHRFISWQAIQNKLSTKDRLHFLSSSTDSRCPLCKSERETRDHLFFFCSYSAWVWRCILWKISDRKKQLPSLVAEEKNQRLFEGKSSHKQDILSSILLSTRIRVLHLKPQDNLSDLAIKIASNFNLPLFQKDKPTKFCRWIPPYGSHQKLNCDASLSSDGGSVGGLIRNSVGDSLGCYSLCVSPAAIHELEIEAVLHGVILAKKLKSKHIWIESDSVHAVRVIKELELEDGWEHTSFLSASMLAIGHTVGSTWAEIQKFDFSSLELLLDDELVLSLSQSQFATCALNFFPYFFFLFLRRGHSGFMCPDLPHS